MHHAGSRCSESPPCFQSPGPCLLAASHIKPWAARDPATERLAPDDNPLLNSLHDRAFDQGLITLDRQLRVMAPPDVPKDDKAVGDKL